MAITSLNFFIFVAIVMVVYYFCVPKKYQWIVLLAAGYIFYAFAGWRLFVYIIFTSLTVFCGALLVKKTSRPKLTIACVIIINFAILASFKWWNPLAQIGNNFILPKIGINREIPLNPLLLPLGISFYTFQAIGYLIDVYRKTIEPERNIFKFALFVSFFPQLIQGPISRHSELAEQLYVSRKFDYGNVYSGFQLMLWGLFKKLVIADRMIVITDHLFFSANENTGIINLAAIIIYTIWLYIDFSAGVDIVRGVGQMLGIIMPQNFMRPFFAVSLPDFWRRFHITLNDWWRDYLFYPIILSKPMTRLGKFLRKRAGAGFGKVFGIYTAIIVVRLVNAMWLGADTKYIFNGLYYGIVIVAGMIAAPVFRKLIALLRINAGGIAWKTFQIIRTFILNCFGHAFLAAASVSIGLNVITSIFRNPDVQSIRYLEFGSLSNNDVLIIICSLILVLITEAVRENGISVRASLNKSKLPVQWCVMMLGIWAVLLLGRYGFGYDASAFVYMGF